MFRKATPSLPATSFPSVVFPDPEGPNRMIPFGMG